MIRRVYEQVVQTGMRTIVVTDNEEIASVIEEIKGEVVLVKDDVASGSERIFLAYQRFFQRAQPKLIINVQGDSPLINPQDLRDLITFHSKNDYDLTTLVSPVLSLGSAPVPNELLSPDTVKVIFSPQNGRCHYFSRQLIPARPYPEKTVTYYKHIGVYSFRPQALIDFSREKKGTYEEIEGLEQLRALEMGLNIGAVIAARAQNYIGVDRPEDIEKVEGVLDAQSD